MDNESSKLKTLYKKYSRKLKKQLYDEHSNNIVEVFFI